MTDDKRFYITTAISYPNGAPHIGHAYEALSTDAMARFKRLDGYDTYFLTGTDVHGQKMLQTARAEGIEPIELADRNSDQFQAMVEALNCSNDDFIRTSQERHHVSSQEIWRRMEANGDIYLDKYAGWYSVRDEAYFAESELVDGMAPTGAPVEWVEEPSYFFDLSKWREPLLKFYEENPDFIAPDGYQLVEVTRSTDNYFANLDIKASYLGIDYAYAENLRFSLGVRKEVFDQSVTTATTFNVIVQLFPLSQRGRHASRSDSRITT